MKYPFSNTKKLKLTAALMASLAASVAIADSNDRYEKDSTLKDAWIDGKIETAFLVNRHLNNFKIDTEVKAQTAYLTGTVESEVDKELAEQIAIGIKGVKNVENKLKVEDNAERRKNQYNSDDGRNFGTWYDDTTTSAAIKSKLLWNSAVDGLDVNVDTNYGIVTLRGNVDDAAQKSLVQQIAVNTDGVREVRNRLRIKKKS